MSGRIHIVEDIPPFRDHASKHYYENGTFKMLIDLATGHLFVTELSFPDDIQGIPHPIRKFFRKLRDTDLTYKKGGPLLLELNQFVVDHWNDLPPSSEVVVVQHGIRPGTQVNFRGFVYEVLAVIPSPDGDESQDEIVISMPVKWNPMRAFLHIAESLTDPNIKWKNVRVPRSQFSSVGEQIFIRDIPFDGINLAQQALSYFAVGAASSAFTFGWGAAMKMPMLAVKVHGRAWLSWHNWRPHLTRAAAAGARIVGGQFSPEMQAITKTLGLTYASSNMALPAGAIAATLLTNQDEWAPAASFTRNILIEGASGVAQATEVVIKKTGELLVGTGRVAGATVGAAVEGLAGNLPEGIKSTISDAIKGGTTTIAIVVGALLSIAVIRSIN